MLGHVLGDGGLNDIDSKLERYVINAPVLSTANANPESPRRRPLVEPQLSQLACLSASGRVVKRYLDITGRGPREIEILPTVRRHDF